MVITGPITLGASSLMAEQDPASMVFLAYTYEIGIQSWILDKNIYTIQYNTYDKQKHNFLRITYLTIVRVNKYFLTYYYV